MKKILIPTLLTALLAAGVSCSKWTEPEALDFPYTPPGQENAAVYEAYLKQLRDYKKSDHKILMVEFAAPEGRPTRQPDHLNSLPDIVDYVCVSHPENMTSELVDEMRELLSRKGTQSLANVDYMAIQNDWDEMISEMGEAEEIPGDAEFQEYCRQRTKAMIESCDKFGFAGIVVAYKGTITSPGQKIFMDMVYQWRQTHRNRIMIMHGFIQNLLDEYRPLVGDSRYIVLWANTANAASDLTRYVAGRLDSYVPSDRFMVESAIPPLQNPTQTGPTPAVAAEWLSTVDERFSKSGIYITNAQDDYYSTGRIYNSIRSAAEMITSMATDDQQTE